LSVQGLVGINAMCESEVVKIFTEDPPKQIVSTLLIEQNNKRSRSRMILVEKKPNPKLEDNQIQYSSPTLWWLSLGCGGARISTFTHHRNSPLLCH